MSPSSDVYSTREIDSSYIEIRREKHRWRHWKWSGIFPYGGWIPDPHFIGTRVFEFPPEVTERLPSPARYQGFDINPWFEDETSEVVVAIEAAGKVFECRLDPTTFSKPRYAFVNGSPIDSFVYEDSLIFVTTVSIVRPVMIHVGLPLESAAPASLHYRDSTVWRTILPALQARCREGAFERAACERLDRYEKWTLQPLAD